MDNRNRWRNSGSEERPQRRWTNFGESARPYGEDYGEDRGDEGRQSRGDMSNRFSGGASSRRRPDADVSDWWDDDHGFDYGMSRTGSHAQIGFHQEDEEAYGDRRYGSRERQRGYMSDDDYDRGRPHYRENRGYEDEDDFGSRGYSREDYPHYRERYRRTEYPETYRSAASGYMSEHVGGDSGREDYNQNVGRGNLYGTRYHLPSGPFRGRGPKNYRRSDDRILEEINDKLTDDPFVDATDVSVVVENGEVVLTGNVVDKTQKRRIEDIVGAVPGVTQVENRLRRPLLATPF